MPCERKCVRCSRDLFECKSKEVKELPCKHYCHSSCMVLFHEEEGEEAYCSCGHRIPRDLLKKTMDEIKEQQRIDEEEECLVCAILGHRPNCQAWHKL